MKSNGNIRCRDCGKIIRSLIDPTHICLPVVTWRTGKAKVKKRKYKTAWFNDLEFELAQRKK